MLFQGYDIIEDMYSPKTSATNFVHELCTCRAKENLAPLLHLVTSTFDVFSVRLLFRYRGLRTGIAKNPSRHYQETSWPS